ncbi:MAG: hypothetical protein HN975_16715 [Anaerolineae bacterium]|jgi:hypothetical protein|nr:hypothetical protein [Anaerolineae bacterium]
MAKLSISEKEYQIQAGNYQSSCTPGELSEQAEQLENKAYGLRLQANVIDCIADQAQTEAQLLRHQAFTFELGSEPGELTTKEEKLRHYATRDLMPFLQFDGFYCPDGGLFPVGSPDDDWDWVSCGATDELMSGAPNVRVLITPDTSQKEALRLLKKIRTWIKEDGLKDPIYYAPKNKDQITEWDLPF